MTWGRSTCTTSARGSCPTWGLSRCSIPNRRPTGWWIPVARCSGSSSENERRHSMALSSEIFGNRVVIWFGSRPDGPMPSRSSPSSGSGSARSDIDMRLALLALCALLLSLASSLLPPPVQAQVVSNQAFEITSGTAHPTVGDTVLLNFRVRLDERDLLFDTVPRPIGAVPQGVRLLPVDKLQRTPVGFFYGHARLAFYRPGHQPVPIFGLPF